jgi:hypothetical protein
MSETTKSGWPLGDDRSFEQAMHPVTCVSAAELSDAIKHLCDGCADVPLTSGKLVGLLSRCLRRPLSSSWACRAEGNPSFRFHRSMPPRVHQDKLQSLHADWVVIRGSHGALISGKDAYITVVGTIEDGDYARFRRLADAIPLGFPVGVGLKGPGGSLNDGLNIGLLIRGRHYNTAASGGCDSSCAFAWIAGERRVIEAGASVGFHSAYEGRDPDHADGGANAKVGAYLSSIGLSYATISSLIGHDPSNFQYISNTTATDIDWNP